MTGRGGHPDRRWRRLVGVSLLVVAALSAAGCRIKGPKIKVEGVSLDSIGLKKVNLLIKFKVTNRSDFQIRVRSLHATIVIAEEEFASGAVAEPIPPCDPDESIELAAKCAVDYRKFMLVIREGQKHHGVPYTVIGKGVTDVLFLPIPLKVSGEGKLQLGKKNKIRNIRLHLLGSGPPPCDGSGFRGGFPRPAEAGRAGSPRFSEARDVRCEAKAFPVHVDVALALQTPKVP